MKFLSKGHGNPWLTQAKTTRTASCQSLAAILAGITTLALSAICSSPSSAATIYTYTGHLFTFVSDSPVIPGSYDMTMNVTGQPIAGQSLIAGHQR